MKDLIRPVINAALPVLVLLLATSPVASYEFYNGNSQTAPFDTIRGDDDLVAVKGDITFDIHSDPGGYGNNLPQYTPACGDDPNEYLIREHRAGSGTEGVSEFQPLLDDSVRSNYYVCADRPTDCAYNGKVYHQGQTEDISSFSGDEEAGDGINDPEVCLDIDSSVPGGEWYDMDNDLLVNQTLKSYLSDDVMVNGVYGYRNTRYWGDNPGTDRDSPNGGAPVGYATEDDCDPDLDACDDAGDTLSGDRWFNAGNFSVTPGDPEGAKQDNFDSGLGYEGVHNRIQDMSDQYEPGATTAERWESQAAYSEPTPLYDTIPGPDNWSLSDDLDNSVSNIGESYEPGECYARSGGERTDIRETSVFKNERIFGNSYADAEDIDGDSVTEGVWKDPDDLGSESKIKFSCDLTGPDKGYGWDPGTGGKNDWHWKNTGDKDRNSNSKIVVGNIYFQKNDGDTDSWEQEEDACGDDAKEYLMEELGESPNSKNLEGRWACGTHWEQCVSRNSDNKKFYEIGQYEDTNEIDEQFGRFKNDEEICTLDEVEGFGKRGVWYDQDYGDIDGDGSQETCRENTLYGSQGVRWFPPSYIEDYPFSVRKGIDDDWNARLEELWKDGDFTDNVTSRPGQDSWDFDEESPVSTGTLNNTIATPGFCGGDDGDERLIVQRCQAQACDTDTSVLGVVEANKKTSCILDQSKYPQVSGNKRQIYQPGESVTFDYGASTREASCFDGVWYDEWPIVFQQDRMDVGKGETRSLSFGVINARSDSRKFRVELVDTDVAQFAEFGSKDGDSFVVEVPGQATKSFDVEVYGGDTSIGSSTSYADLRVQGTAIDGHVSGEDRAGINIKDSVQTGGGERKTGPKNVPGIGFIQLLALSFVSTLLFFSQS